MALSSVLYLSPGTSGNKGFAQTAAGDDTASDTSPEQSNAPSATAQPADIHNMGQPQNAVPILTVDRDQLFAGSLYGKRVLAELEQERRRLANEARKVEAALAAEEQNLTEQRNKLTPEAFRVLADAFDAKVQALREERPQLEQNFSRRFEMERATYFEKIGPILGRVVRERGGVMIIDRRAILLTTRNIDVTQDAIARIDALLGDGKTSDAPPSDRQTSQDQPASKDQTEAPAEN